MTAARSDLADLLRVLVAGPVRAQALLDEGWADAIARWRDVGQFFVAKAPPPRRADIAAVLAPAAPTRQVLRRYELECSVRVRMESRRGGALRVQPLDLGWEIIRGETRESASRVVIEVESVPAPVVTSWTDPPLMPPEEREH